MDPSDFNRKVWEATVEAQFHNKPVKLDKVLLTYCFYRLASVRVFDPKTQAFLIPSPHLKNSSSELLTLAEKSQTNPEILRSAACFYRSVGSIHQPPKC